MDLLRNKFINGDLSNIPAPIRYKCKKPVDLFYITFNEIVQTYDMYTECHGEMESGVITMEDLRNCHTLEPSYVFTNKNLENEK